MKKKLKEKKKVKSFLDCLIYFPRIIFSIFIFLLIFVSPLIVISGSKSFYKNNLNEDCFQMISEKDCKDLQMNAFYYLKGKETLDSRYDTNEQSHFADVKVILDFAKSFVWILFIFTVFYFSALYFFDKKEIFKTLKLAGIISLSFILILLLSVIFNFSGTFFLFHELAFPQGNWTFPFDSTIITVFSEAFFVHAAFVSFLISLGLSIIILGISFMHNKRN